MTFFDKMKWVLGILVVFVLIVATNLIDRNNFVRVRNSVVTIYEDRLIAKNLIFKISESVQEKELAVALSDSLFFAAQNTEINEEIQGFIERYGQTKLTTKEELVFGDLKENLQSLKQAESTYIDSGFENRKAITRSIDSINENLSTLSEIQIDEGRRQMWISQKAINSVELFTQIEIYLLVFLAIAIQIIILYKPREKA